MNKHLGENSSRHPHCLNIAAYLVDTQALGPGRRSVVWVQGCCFHCKGCIAPDWIPQISNHLVSPEDLAQTLVSNPHIQGLTISGGEPMLQAPALCRLIYAARSIRPIDVICFTGFRYEVLEKQSKLPGVKELLQSIDLLIDGPYIQEMNTGIGLRGSSNQRFIFLTDKLRNQPLESQPRDIEFHVFHGEVIMAGIPPKRPVSFASLNLNGRRTW